MISLRKRKTSHIGIMISPMIDMSFLLLVFFVISTMNMDEVKTVPVQLPKSTQVRIDKKSVHHITVKKDGTLYLEDKAITADAFRAWGQKQAARDANVSIVIYGDGIASYQRILSVLDLCKEAGITRVGMAAEKAEPK